MRLVNDTLDLERLAAGRVDVEPRPVRPGELLAATAQVVQPVADAAGVELSWEAGELELMADPDRVVQALINLVANAVKFSPAGTCVRTRIEVSGIDALVSVEDEGRGIPVDQLESSSSASGRSTRPTGATRAGPGSAWRSRARSSSSTRAGSGPRASRAGARRSASPCRSTALVDRRRLRPPRAPARGARARGAPARAARVAFEDPETLAASEERFVAVLVAGAGGSRSSRRTRRCWRSRAPRSSMRA